MTLLAIACCAVITSRAPAQTTSLDTYSSEHYIVHTTLTKDEARVYGRHMDRVFRAYQQKFSNIGLSDDDRKPMPMYLFRTRLQYVSFLAGYGMNAQNTGGMFFINRDLQGLATFTQDRPITETFAVLQHEGFHQFAYKHIGPDLPIWVNEGLAQYFEDGIFVKGKLVLDLADERRIESVKAALQAERNISFDKMLSISDREWSETLASSPAQASLLYDQAWSMVFFLATGDRGRYIKPFRAYLQDVAQGHDSSWAFRKAFELKSIEPFERAWQRYAGKAQPDVVNIVLSRINFLGYALQYLKEKNLHQPRSTAQLRSTLQKMKYTMVRSSHGITTEISAMDESVYRYPLGRRNTKMFEILEPERDDLPPRITAPGLKPEPTLIWSRDAEGKLVQAVVFN